MLNPTRTITATIAALMLLPSAVVAKNAPRRDPSKIPGSTVRQLMLKQALEKHLAGTLVVELNHNKRLWGSLAPEQLRSLRQRYYAFLRQDPDKQAALMKAAEEFRKLSARQRQAYVKRAAWLERVIASLTPAQRQALKQLAPAERAKRLLELKAELVDSQPITQPTSQPATQPAHMLIENK